MKVENNMKEDMKGYIVYGSIYMKSPEKANP
jgi:hypothetical protein